MVVDKVVRNWVSMVTGGVVGPFRWGREVLHRIAFFYADSSLVASTDPGWIQGAFDTLTGLFGNVGLRINVGTTVGMLFHPLCAVVTQSGAT